MEHFVPLEFFDFLKILILKNPFQSMVTEVAAVVHLAVVVAVDVLSAVVVAAADAVEAEAAEEAVPVADGNGKSTRIANLLIV